jgi:hypothetical protein
MMPELIRYRNKTMQSGIFLLRYRNEMTDAGMPMPVFVLRKPMPTYAKNSYEKILTYASVKKKRLCDHPSRGKLYKNLFGQVLATQLNVKFNIKLSGQLCAMGTLWS